MNTQQAIILARKHVITGAPKESSALFCLSDAIEMMERGDLESAKKWALRSMAYSVGVFHADYKRASV
jgi:hypothetical protein